MGISFGLKLFFFSQGLIHFAWRCVLFAHALLLFSLFLS